MSWQLGAFTLAMRLFLKPILRRTTTPQAARRDLGRAARLAKAPRFLLHLPDHPASGLHWISVGSVNPDWVILFCHGGGYLAGNPTTYAALLGRLSKLTGLAVIAPDYRLAPEHPAPAAFDDVVAGHATLIAKGYAPDRIILGGDSAGGGLALALLADLCARNLRPAGLFGFSPWTDLAMTGSSLVENAAIDPVIPVERMAETVARVTGALAASDPRLSPLYASFARPPPVWIQVGAGEVLRDDSRAITHLLRASGGRVALTEWSGVPHVWHMLDGYLPEARAALIETAGFIKGLIPRP